MDDALGPDEPTVSDAEIERADRSPSRGAAGLGADRFAWAFRASPLPMLLIEMPAGRVVDVNLRFCELLGYREAEVIGRTTLEIGLYSDPAERAALVAEIDSGRGSAGFAVRLRDRVGRERPFRVFTRSIRPGPPSLELAILEDLSELRAAEARVAEQWHRLRQILEALPDRVYVVDERGLLCEAIAGEPTGRYHPRDELVGRSLADLVDPATLAAALAALERVLRTGAAERIEYEVDLAGQARRFSARVAAGPVLDGRRTVIVLARDVTGDRTAERRARMTQAAVEASQMALLWLRPDLRIDSANEAAARLFGVEAPEDLAGAALDRFGAALARDVEAAVGELAGAAKSRFETEIVTAGRAPVPLGVSLVGAELEEARFFALVMADLSHQHSAEEQLRRTHEMLNRAQRMEAVGRLAAGVAHDFNNLLAVIVGYAELMAEPSSKEEDRREAIEEIQFAVERGARLTRQLLAFSRQQVVEPRVVSPTRVVRGLEKLLRQILGENLALRVREADDGVRVRIDPAQLEQVLLNLAANSRDAAPLGGYFDVAIRCRRIEGEVAGAREPIPPGDYAEIEIADTGPGMSPEVERHVFEPFFSTKERGQGTGLGLATVYGIVRQAGGFLALETGVGKGACFRLFLPALAVDPATEERELVGSPTGHGEIVLYVEDDQDLRPLTARWIRRFGYETLVARDAREALEIAASRSSIDLLVTDVVLPGLHGLGLARNLAADRPDLRVLFVSGYAEDRDVLTEIAEGRLRLLSKPFSQSALAREIASALVGPAFSA